MQALVVGVGVRASPSAFRSRIAYQFRFDNDTWSGHDLRCADREMGESRCRWTDDYGDNRNEMGRLHVPLRSGGEILPSGRAGTLRLIVVLCRTV